MLKLFNIMKILIILILDVEDIIYIMILDIKDRINNIMINNII